MLKKFLAIAILTTTSSFSFAAAPYVGAGLGITANTAKDTTAGSYRGAPLRAVVGYGGLVNPAFYLGGEASGTVGTATISDNRTNRLRSTYGYEVSVLPGAVLSDTTLAFLRFGVGKKHFDDASGVKANTQYGIGLQTSLTRNVDLRGEYAYVKTNSFHGIKPRGDQASFDLIYKFE